MWCNSTTENRIQSVNYILFIFIKLFKKSSFVGAILTHPFNDVNTTSLHKLGIVRLFVTDCQKELLFVETIERTQAHQHFVEEHAERPPVDRLVVLLAENHLAIKPASRWCCCERSLEPPPDIGFFHSDRSLSPSTPTTLTPSPTIADQTLTPVDQNSDPVVRLWATIARSVLKSAAHTTTRCSCAEYKII